MQHGDAAGSGLYDQHGKLNLVKESARRTAGTITLLGWLAVRAVAADPMALTTDVKVTAPTPPNPNLLNDWLRNQSPAWQQLDLGGQLRLRYNDQEKAGAFPNNDFVGNAATNSNAELLTRITGHMGYTPVNGLTLLAAGRVSLESGDKRQPSPDASNLDLYQAYLRLGDLKEFPVQLQVGRQELTYGDLRWVSNSDWNNNGRRFDAAKLRFENSFGWLDAFISHPVYVDRDHPDKWNQYEYFSGLYAASKQLVPWQETQVYFLSYNVGANSPSVTTPTATGPSARDIYTYGTLMKSLPGQLRGWDYSIELTGQTGSLTTNATKGSRLDLRACSTFDSVGYTFEQAWATPRLGLGYEFGSGDDNPKDGTVGTIQNLFGYNHRFYGTMDLFGMRNMHIPRISGSLAPAKDFKFTADYLFFWLDDTNDYLYPETAAARTQNGYGIHPNFNSYVGSELDLIANYTVRAWRNLQVGYGHFFVGDYIKESLATVPADGKAVDADWVYTQVTLNF